jgi:hypothetical protein
MIIDVLLSALLLCVGKIGSRFDMMLFLSDFVP